MLRGIWGDNARFKEQYWSKYKDTYFCGDGAHRDKQGYFWIMGRIDDVMNISGHRIGTMEVESALVSHPDVAESAVVGRPDDITGTAIVAFVSPVGGTNADAAFKKTLIAHVTKEIGAIARPAEIRFTDSLPKTRSGKIMRRLLRDVASGVESTGDTSTLEDFTVLAKLREADED
jgi:acetyl-CoA synthetase